jgi:hypothetical protein
MHYSYEMIMRKLCYVRRKFLGVTVGCVLVQFSISWRKQTVCCDPDIVKVLHPRLSMCHSLDITVRTVLMGGMLAPHGGTRCWCSVQYIALLYSVQDFVFCDNYCKYNRIKTFMTMVY